MSTIHPNEYRLDSNVTIKTPHIVVDFITNCGWFIMVDHIIVKDGVSIRYFNDVGDATDYLIEKNLLITKEYKKFDEKVKNNLKEKV